MAQRFTTGKWTVWAEDSNDYHVHLLCGDTEIEFSANEIDRVVEMLMRVSNSFYLPSVQVQAIDDDDEGA